MKSPAEARRAWVEALRSGEYEQGKGSLHVGEKYCCLGVACRLAVADGVPVKVSVFPGEREITLYDDVPGTLPGSVQEWLGLAGERGEYVARNGRETDLTKRNDGGVSFEKIADLIESEPKGLVA